LPATHIAGVSTETRPLIVERVTHALEPWPHRQPSAPKASARLAGRKGKH